MKKQDRILIVLSHHDSRRSSAIKNILNVIANSTLDCDLAIAIPVGIDKIKIENLPDSCDIIEYDNIYKIGKVKNLIIDTYKNEYRYVHILEDDVVVDDPNFTIEFEQMMQYFNIPICCGHTLEHQNYNFGRPVPRLSISDLKHPIDIINFYSSSAKAYICLDTEYYNEILKFNDNFDYYYLDENFWKRRFFNCSVPFLNFYPGIKDEEKKFHRSNDIPSHLTKENIEAARKEVETAALIWEVDSTIDPIIKKVKILNDEYMGAI